MKILFLLFLLINNLYSSSLPSKLEKKAIKHYINGNYNQYFNNITQLIEKNPDSPEALFYLLTMKIDKTLIHFNRIIPLYKKILKRKNIDFFTRQILLSEIIDNAINNNKFALARQMTEQCGYVTNWNYIGTLNYSYYNDLYHDFYDIEKNLFIDNNDNNKKWKKLNHRTDYGWVPLKYISGDEKGIIYTSTHFYIPYDQNIILWFTSRSSTRVFINLQEIFINDSYTYNFSMNNIYKIKLKKGWHNILIKSLRIDDSFNFKCRLLTEKGYSIAGLKLSLKKDTINKKKISFDKIYPHVYKKYLNLIDLKTKNMLDYFKLSMLDFHYFNENRAIKNLHRFLYIKKDNPFLNYLAGRLYLYKFNKTKKKDYLEIANKFFIKIKKTMPHFLQVKRYLAKYHLKKEKMDKTYQQLQCFNKNTPFDLWGDYFHSIKWDFMAFKNYIQEKKQNDWKDYNNYLIALYCENFDISRTLSIYTNLEKNKFQSFNENFLNLYFKQNNKTNFLNSLNRIYNYNPYKEQYSLYKALYENKNNNLKEAICILKKHLKKQPSYEIACKLGHLLEEKKDSQALYYYQQAYQLKPYNISLYKKISYLNKKKIFFSLEEEYYPVDSQQIIENAFKDKNSNESLIKMYLDLFIIKPFQKRGYTYLIHQIFKIIDEEGKEKFGEVKIPDNSHIIHVKNHISPNIVIEALDYKKHNNYYYISVPELKIGSVIDVCYQVFYSYNWLDYTKYFYFTPFSFQNTDYNVEKTIYVLIQGKNLPAIKFNLQNGKSINYNKTKTDNEIIHIWENEKIKRFKKEYNSVPVMDLIPHIYLSSIPDWKTFHNWYWGKIRSKIKINHNIEKKILKLYENSKKNNKFNSSLFIKKCYYYIQNNINNDYDYLYYPENIEFVYSRKKGGTEEKTLLMYAFLKNININCQIVLVRNNHFSQFSFSLIYPEAFNSLLLHIPAQKNIKNEIFIDFSNKNLQFGIINSQYTHSRGFLMNKYKYKFITTPAILSKDMIIENYNTIITNISASITGRVIYSGFFNIHKENYKDFFTRENQIFEYINELINRIAIHDYKISNLDCTDKNLIITFSGEVEALNHINIFYDKVNLSEKYISKSQRNTPLKIYHPLIKTITNTIVITNNYKLNLKDYNIHNDFGNYNLSIKKHKGKIVIIRHIKIIPQVIEKKDYKKFLKFCRQIDRIEEEKLVLE